MTRLVRATLLVAFTAVLVAVLLARRGERASAGEPVAATAAAPVPRLVDLGAGKCIPCKAMAPILEELRTEYAGRLDVVFIDVWQKPEAAAPYGIRMIPTQIYLGADGRELGRHEGYASKADILARWKALGVQL